MAHNALLQTTSAANPGNSRSGLDIEGISFTVLANKEKSIAEAEITMYRVQSTGVYVFKADSDSKLKSDIESSISTAKKQ